MVVGERSGDIGPEMLTGVGIFVVELIEDVRSCFAAAGGPWKAVVSGDRFDPMLDWSWLKAKEVDRCSGDA